jgi:hypothetical protein
MRFRDCSYWNSANHDQPNGSNEPDELRYRLQLLIPPCRETRRARDAEGAELATAQEARRELIKLVSELFINGIGLTGMSTPCALFTTQLQIARVELGKLLQRLPILDC